MSSNLLFREWLIVCLFSGLLVVVSLAAWRNRSLEHKNLYSNLNASEWIEITVTGAVQEEGVYRFCPGVTLREVLQKVKLKKAAEKRALDLKKCFYVSGSVEIPERIRKQKVEKKRT